MQQCWEQDCQYDGYLARWRQMVDTEVVFVLEGEVETHKEGMVEEGEDFLLTTDILHLLLTNDVSLV